MSSSTSSFKRWLIVFFTLVLGVSIPFLAASEWMLRTFVLPVDGFEQISSKMRASSIPNAAFGDSHAAAVSNFDDKDFINLGLGGTTIRQMSERAHYYFSKVKPGNIIIEADSHLFADYRLEAQGVHIPESYASGRLAVFDERHRRFMLDYWERFRAAGLKPKESNRPDQLWQMTNGLTTAETTQPAAAAQPAAQPEPAPQPAPAKPEPVAAKPEPAPATPAPAAAPQPQASIPSPAAEAIEKTSPPESLSRPEPPVPAQKAELPAQKAESVPAPASPEAPKSEPKEGKDESNVSAEFNAFMDYEVRTHTPVNDFELRDEARIYAEMIDFLIGRGAKVCLMSYPVDRFYRERADKIPTYPAVKEFYKKLAKERNIPYVSFWSRFDDPEMYQNTDHVNAKGSAILAAEARKACFPDK